MRTLYVVFGSKNATALAGRIAAAYPSDFLSVGASGEWLIVGDGTAKDVSDKLGITDGNVGSAIVIASAGYYGRAPTNVWEWIAARLKAPANG